MFDIRPLVRGKRLQPHVRIPLVSPWNAQSFNANIRNGKRFRVNISYFEDLRGDCYSVNLKSIFRNLQDRRRPRCLIILLTVIITFKKKSAIRGTVASRPCWLILIDDRLKKSNGFPTLIFTQGIYIYNSILIWELTILKSGARTPRTVTKFAVKAAIDLTQTI